MAEPLPRLLVVLGDGSATVRDILRYATGLVEPVLLFDRADVALMPLRDALGDEVLCVEYAAGDLDAVSSAHAGHAFDAITTFAEQKIESTAWIAEALGLPYHSRRCAQRLVDKGAQRAALAEAGLGIGFRVADDAQAARDAIADLGVPCVFKPLTSTGSRNTFAVGPGDAHVVLDIPQAAFPAIVEERLQQGVHPRSDRLADVVSIETVFSEGRPVHFAVTAKFALAPPFRETGSVLPSQLPPSDVAAVTDLATQALHALGVSHGATHTEIKLTPTGPAVVEVNGGLGGYIGRLLHMSTGTHGVEVVLRGVCGLEVGLPALRAVAAIRLVVPPVEATSLQSRIPAEALREIAGVTSVGVLARPGDAVDYRAGWWSNVAEVWSSAPDWDAVDDIDLAAQGVIADQLRWS